MPADRDSSSKRKEPAAPEVTGRSTRRRSSEVVNTPIPGGVEADVGQELAALRERNRLLEQQLAARQTSVNDTPPTGVQINLSMSARDLEQLEGAEIEKFVAFLRDGNFTGDAHLKFIKDTCKVLIDTYFRSDVYWNKVQNLIKDKVTLDGEPLTPLNWRRWTRDVLGLVLVQMFPRGDTASFGAPEVLKTEPIRYQWNSMAEEQKFVKNILKPIENWSEEERKDAAKNKPLVEILKRKLAKFESTPGSYKLLNHNMINLPAPATIDEWVRNYVEACAKTREQEIVMALAGATYGSRHTDKHKQDTKAAATVKGAKCTGCGLATKDAHTAATCQKRNHAQWNPDPTKQWADTEGGKAFTKLGYSFLPAFSLEDARKKPPKTVTPKGNQGKHKDNSSCFCAMSTPNNNAILIPIAIPGNPQGSRGARSEVRAEAFLDSGCLVGDCITSEFADRLVNIGYILNSAKSRVCSGLDGRCTEGLHSVSFSLFFVNEITKNTEEIKIHAKVIDSNIAFDFIIGLATIRQYNLTHKCQSYFIEEESAMRTGDAQTAKPSTETTADPNLVGALIKPKADLLTSVPDADDEIDPDTTDAAAPFLQKDVGDVLEGIQVGGTAGFQAKIRQLCEEFRDVFSNEVGKTPAKVPEYQLTLDLSKWKTPANCGPPRLQSAVKQTEILTQITAMLAAGVIVKSAAAYYSHVQLEPKPGGAWRFCVDYRNLNAATTSEESWPLPHIKQTLQRIGAKNATVFGTLDMTSGYHQLGVAAACTAFTAFIAFCGVYEFVRVPFGLKGAPGYFQKQMHTVVLQGLIYSICELYIDDCIVHAKTEEEFLTNLRTILMRFREFGIKAKPKKCKLGFEELEYVGYLLSAKGVKVLEPKVAKVVDFPQPVFMKQLKSFLGLINHFRDFIPNYSKLSHSLNTLTNDYKPSHKIEWTDQAIEDFKSLKELLAKAPMLHFIDPELPIHLYTDACDFGIGGYLFQVETLENGNTRERPVAFISKSLTKTQIRWGIPQKEAYAVFACIKMLTHQLRDVRFRLKTDHKNLTYINMNSNPMIVRWKLALMEFDFEVEHSQTRSQGCAQIT